MKPCKGHGKQGWDGISCIAKLRRRRREENAIHDQPRWCKKCGELVKSLGRSEKLCSLSVEVEDPMLGHSASACHTGDGRQGSAHTVLNCDAQKEEDNHDRPR